MNHRCTVYRVRRLSRQITQLYNAALKSHGLKITQLSVLTAVHDLQPLTVVEMARALTLDSTTASRALKSVVKEGWIEVGPGDDDRSKLLRLTEAGQTKFEQASKARNAQEEKFREALNGRVSDTFLNDLNGASAVLRELKVG